MSTYSKPVYTVGSDATFIPRTYTIYNWGDQTNLPGVIKPLEQNAYIEVPYYIDYDHNWTLP